MKKIKLSKVAQFKEMEDGTMRSMESVINHKDYLDKDGHSRCGYCTDYLSWCSCPRRSS